MRAKVFPLMLENARETMTQLNLRFLWTLTSMQIPPTPGKQVDAKAKPGQIPTPARARRAAAKKSAAKPSKASKAKHVPKANAKKPKDLG